MDPVTEGEEWELTLPFDVIYDQQGMTTEILAFDSLKQWKNKVRQIVKEVPRVFANTYETYNGNDEFEGVYVVVRHPIDLPYAIDKFFFTHLLSGLNDGRTTLLLRKGRVMQVSVGLTSAEPIEPGSHFTVPAALFVLENNGTIIGKASVRLFYEEMELPCPAIETIEVIKPYRGLGYGKLFLSEIENYFEKRGFEGLGYTNATKEGASFIKSRGYEPLTDPIGDFVEEGYKPLD